jgi:hypothetical protein
VWWTGGAHGSTVDCGWHKHWARRRLAGVWRVGATGRGGHGGTRWAAHRGAGGGVAAGRRRWLELVARAKEGVKGLTREGKRCGEVWGGVTVALMPLTPLKMARLRRGLDGRAN